MGPDKRMRQEKIVEYDVLYQKFFDQELSAPPVDAASADILKKQADALREQAELLDLAEDLIMVLDMDHRILFWNRGAEKKYGWSRREVRGENIHTLLRTSFPQSLKKYPLYGQGLYLIEGRVMLDYGSPSIDVQRCGMMPLKPDPRSV